MQASRGYLPVNAVEPERDRSHNFHYLAVLQEPIVNQSVTDSSANTSMVNVIYVLYLLALISGVTALIGVIMAYVYKDDGAGVATLALRAADPHVLVRPGGRRDRRRAELGVDRRADPARARGVVDHPLRERPEVRRRARAVSESSRLGAVSS